jgi:acetylglutamate kinase
MKDVGQRLRSVEGLRHAMPYVRLFKGKRFVVKTGGGGVETDAAALALANQLEILVVLGIRVVLVHGGGGETSALLSALGAEPRFAAGRRVTDEAALAAVTMTLNGTVNTRLLAACRAIGLPAVGLSGVDSGLLRVRRRPPVTVDGETVDYGHVGDIAAVDAQVLERILDSGYLPVTSSIAADDQGRLLNVNADSAAAAIAVAMRADKLVLLTGAPGILEDPEDRASLVPYTDLEGLEALRASGALRNGMLPKTEAIAAALRGGVGKVHVVSHSTSDSLLLEFFTNEGIGTMVVEDIDALPAAERF